jgi:hypothetical protein
VRGRPGFPSRRWASASGRTERDSVAVRRIHDEQGLADKRRGARHTPRPLPARRAVARAPRARPPRGDAELLCHVGLRQFGALANLLTRRGRRQTAARSALAPIACSSAWGPDHHGRVRIEGLFRNGASHCLKRAWRATPFPNSVMPFAEDVAPCYARGHKCRDRALGLAEHRIALRGPGIALRAGWRSFREPAQREPLRFVCSGHLRTAWRAETAPAASQRGRPRPSPRCP